MNRTLLRASRRGAVVVAGTTLLLALTAVPASAAQDLCVSINGTVRVQKGTATCSSVAGPGNVAIARGANSTATAGFSAGDQHNRAVASGDNSVAFAGIGSGNTATASADDSFASAGVGNGNTATSTGTHSGATAEGTNQTAIASGVNGSAVARFGENSRATASGDDSFANANGGDHNIATASGDNSSALAVTGNHNTAIASAQSSSATASSATTTPPSPARPTAPRSRRVAGLRTAADPDCPKPPPTNRPRRSKRGRPEPHGTHRSRVGAALWGVAHLVRFRHRRRRMPIATVVAMKSSLDQSVLVAEQRLAGAILGTPPRSSSSRSTTSTRSTWSSSLHPRRDGHTASVRLRRREQACAVHLRRRRHRRRPHPHGERASEATRAPPHPQPRSPAVARGDATGRPKGRGGVRADGDRVGGRGPMRLLHRLLALRITRSRSMSRGQNHRRRDRCGGSARGQVVVDVEIAGSRAGPGCRPPAVIGPIFSSANFSKSSWVSQTSVTLIPSVGLRHPVEQAPGPPAPRGSKPISLDDRRRTARASCP